MTDKEGLIEISYKSQSWSSGECGGWVGGWRSKTKLITGDVVLVED